MIYIDPPYNTGKDFVYKDDFSDTLKAYKEQLSNITTNTNTDGRFHSNWLNMMYPRLRLAKNLLRDDGVIFISIDDNEVAQLKLLCDEIFGQDNFISQIIWTNKEGGGSSDSKHFRIKHEYVFVYAKNKENLIINGLDVEDLERYRLEDRHINTRGKYQLIKLDSASIQYSSSLDYPIKAPDNSEIYPSSESKKSCWRWGKEKLQWGIENDFVVIKKDSKNKWAVYTKQYLNCDNDGNIKARTIQPMAVIDKFSTTQSNKALKELMGDSVFSYSKPVELIQFLLQIATNKNDIVLDFFSGSATTAHALMQLNAQDGGNRQYILVQIPEPTEAKSIAYQNGYKNICEIGLTRIKKSSEKIKQDYPNASFDDGVKIFYLDSSNLSTWDGENITQENLFTKLERIKKDRNELDLIYEFILKQGYSLSSSIEYKNDKYFIKDSDKTMIVCLKTSDFNELLKYKNSEIIIKDELLDDITKLNTIENSSNLKTF